MIARRFATLSRVAALAVALVLVQTAAVAHSDLDAHPADEACALCCGVATLGAANVASPHTFEVVAQPFEHSDYAPVLRVARRADHRLARGPPQAS